ncbi:sigma 54-interacting transcriptional regulator [Proteinivorax hydrogeniformans]|uniref:Sigma 54-interacting transcriptional regulator n=1 Tax=Proteinivorax hydrogeniformans TaxID=1826727 RepID=A0AAU8HR90_9FIRM
MDLMKIAPNVLKISQAIASVIGVDVTVVDKKLVRVAGTGSYGSRCGEKVSARSAFGVAIRNKESFIIEEAGNHEVCKQCESIKDCQEFAEVCCPIKINDEVIGVIGLIAFDKQQREKILYNKDNLMNFLNKMAELVSSKLAEQSNLEEIELLAKKLEIVLNSVDKGIILANHSGDILSYNKSALKLFGLSDPDKNKINMKHLIGDSAFESSIVEDCKVKNKEFVYRHRKNYVRGIFDTNPITIDNKTCGIVFVFTKLSDALGVVNDITTGSIVTNFADIIGDSDTFVQTKNTARQASQSSSSIVIQGESGTGKELFARAIHFNSDRKAGPFIAINCSAIPDQLLESELFGYEEGAFTGAMKGGKAGKFLLANGGTIFLDEIGDMPLHLQAKLLRVLQEQMIEKIGGKSLIPIDIRVIAATNKDLEKKVSQNEFRDDLFYRINVIPLSIPPLRERKDDIYTLVKHLLSSCNKRLHKEIENVDDEVYDIFIKYRWPGNVRELENTIEYAVNMCNGSVIEREHLPSRLLSSSLKDKGNYEIVPIKELEKREIEKALAKFKCVEKAAKALGIGRATLYRKIRS